MSSVLPHFSLLHQQLGQLVFESFKRGGFNTTLQNLTRDKEVLVVFFWQQTILVLVPIPWRPTGDDAFFPTGETIHTRLQRKLSVLLEVEKRRAHHTARAHAEKRLTHVPILL